MPCGTGVWAAVKSEFPPGKSWGSGECEPGFGALERKVELPEEDFPAALRWGSSDVLGGWAEVPPQAVRSVQCPLSVPRLALGTQRVALQGAGACPAVPRAGIPLHPRDTQGLVSAASSSATALGTSLRTLGLSQLWGHFRQFCDSHSFGDTFHNSGSPSEGAEQGQGSATALGTPQSLGTVTAFGDISENPGSVTALGTPLKTLGKPQL